MSFLTRHEQMLVAFVLAAFTIGLGIKHWREIKTVRPALPVEQTTY